MLPGTAVTVVALDGPERLVAGRVVGPAETAAGCPALLDDRREVNLAGGLSFYRVEPVEPVEPWQLAIGVVANAGMAMGNGALDIDGDGRGETFGYCATSEGVLFIVGAASDGRPLWEGEYHLGHPVRADCYDAVLGR